MQLAALAGVTVVILVLGLISRLDAAEAKRRDLEHRLALATLTASLLDERLTQVLQLLRAAAADLSDAAGSQTHLASPEPMPSAELSARLREHQLRLSAYGRRLYWVDAQGETLWCEPPDAARLAQPLADFSIVSASLRDNLDLVSGLVRSPASEQPYVLLVAPVASPGGAVHSLLVEEIGAEQLELLAIAGQVPGEDVASIKVIDGDGVVLMSPQAEERFRPVCPTPAGAGSPADVSPQATDVLPAACQCYTCYTANGEMPADPEHSLAVAPLRSAAWHVVAAASAGELSRAGGHTWYWVAAGIGLIALGVFASTGWPLPWRFRWQRDQASPEPSYPPDSGTSDNLSESQSAANLSPLVVHMAQLRGQVEAGLDNQRRGREVLQQVKEEHTMELTALYEQLEGRKEMCKRLLGRVLTAQEEERARLARELHDSIGQSLTAIIMTAAAVQDSLPETFASGREKLAGVRSIAVQALHDLRGLIFDLRPEILDDLGLALALRSQIKQSLEPVGVRAQLRTIGLKEHLPREVEITIFRVVQEAITNIARHARATEAVVSLTRRDNRLIVRVEDNGVGFDVNMVNNGSQQAWGLRGMEERVTLLGGEIYISSKPGQGTLIHAEVPLDEC